MFQLGDHSRDFFTSRDLSPVVGWECKTAFANETLLALSTPLAFPSHYADKLYCRIYRHTGDTLSHSSTCI